MTQQLFCKIDYLLYNDIVEKIKLLESIQDIHHQIVKFVEQELRLRTKFDIKYSHYEIIRFLLINKSLTMKDLSQKVMKHKSTVTSLVRKLNDYELLLLQKDKKDDRKQIVTISEKGKSLQSLINSIEQKILLIIHKQLTVQDQNNALSYLNKMQDSLKLEYA